MNNDINIITMVDRAMNIIEYIYNSTDAIGVSKIAKDLDLPKATVFRILNTLEKWDLVKKINADNKYILGASNIKYGEKAKNEFDIVTIATPYMEKLSNDIGETINLGMKYQDDALILKSIEGESSILVSKLIPITPLHCSSIGKLFLSEFNDKELKKYFSSNLSKRTINTITNIKEFIDEEGNIINSSIAHDNEEYEYGLTCIASPIKNKNGKAIAGISISGPTTRLQYKNLEYLEKKLKSTTETISNELNKIK